MIHFAKAHACGNDFLIVEQDQLRHADPAALSRQLCHRNTGIGADGIEYFQWTGGLQGQVKLFNADGSIAEISGNGTRCVAAWMAHQRSAGAGSILQVVTDAGSRECRVVKVTGREYEMTTGMGIPLVSEAEVVLRDGMIVNCAIVNTGNPHCVILVESADFSVRGRSWQSIGEEICFHHDFPAQTNVEFLRMNGPHEIEIRIFERGVGPTTSSGTGTCATGAAAIAMHARRSPLRVIAPGGQQQVEWQGRGSPILLTGPAVLIAEGAVYMDGDHASP